MRRTVFVSILACLGAAAARAETHEGNAYGLTGTGHEVARALTPVEVEGVVVGAPCYIQDGDAALGPKHRDCIKNGQPPAILMDDGTLLLVVPADHKKTKQSANALCAPYLGRRVAARGLIKARGMLRMLAVTSLSPTKPSPAAGIGSNGVSPVQGNGR